MAEVPGSLGSFFYLNLGPSCVWTVCLKVGDTKADHIVAIVIRGKFGYVRHVANPDFTLRRFCPTAIVNWEVSKRMGQYYRRTAQKPET